MTDLLIIGKNGQLGQQLVKISKKLNLKFIAFSKKEFDVSSKKSLEKIKKLKPRIIINTSAYHVTAECEIHPLNAFKINSVAVANLAKLAKELNAKFVTYSTNYVFDGKKKSAYVESDITNPLQMYGLSKLAGEIAALNEYPDGTFIIRTCGVYGGKQGSKAKKGNYILKIISEAKNKGSIYASTKQMVNPTFAGDLAKATLDLMDLKIRGGIYHLANEGTISWYDFAKKILKYKGIKSVKVLAYDKNEENKDFKSPLFSVLKNTKAKKLGVVLPSIDKGLQEYIKEI